MPSGYVYSLFQVFPFHFHVDMALPQTQCTWFHYVSIIICECYYYFVAVVFWFSHYG